MQLITQSPRVSSRAEPSPLFRFRETFARHVTGSELLVYGGRIESGRRGLQTGFNHLQGTGNYRASRSSHSVKFEHLITK